MCRDLRKSTTSRKKLFWYMPAESVTGARSPKESYVFHSLVEGINFALLQYEGPTYFHAGAMSPKA